MDEAAFDSLTRAFGARGSRRELSRLMGGFGLGGRNVADGLE